ncbi:MAG: hypothetical protein OXC60_07645 [Litoreibacter sp.]|nr:hypothetical protein [Litoreibacter sp.]
MILLPLKLKDQCDTEYRREQEVFSKLQLKESRSLVGKILVWLASS